MRTTLLICCLLTACGSTNPVLTADGGCSQTGGRLTIAITSPQADATIAGSTGADGGATVQVVIETNAAMASDLVVDVNGVEEGSRTVAGCLTTIAVALPPNTSTIEAIVVDANTQAVVTATVQVTVTQP